MFKHFYFFCLVFFISTFSSVLAVPLKIDDSNGYYAKEHGVMADGKTDDTLAMQSCLNYVAQHNMNLILPNGIIEITAPLTVIGNKSKSFAQYVGLVGQGADASLGTVIRWNGDTGISNFMLKLDGVNNFYCEGLNFSGRNNVGKILWATMDQGNWASNGWEFEDVCFVNAIPKGSCFYIDGPNNCSRFSFNSCKFIEGKGAIGFDDENIGSLTHSFSSCSFVYGAIGIKINGGSFKAFSCEFGKNSIADVYLQIDDNCTMIGCWSEQSHQFIYGDSRHEPSTMNLIDCTSTSYPWTYWKSNDENPSLQPNNDCHQWETITWLRDTKLTMIGCLFRDQYFGKPMGKISPLVSDFPTVAISEYLPDVNSTGNFCWINPDQTSCSNFIRLNCEPYESKSSP